MDIKRYFLELCAYFLYELMSLFLPWILGPDPSFPTRHVEINLEIVSFGILSDLVIAIANASELMTSFLLTLKQMVFQSPFLSLLVPSIDSCHVIPSYDSLPIMRLIGENPQVLLLPSHCSGRLDETCATPLSPTCRHLFPSDLLLLGRRAEA